jgi:hypothetical protein
MLGSERLDALEGLRHVGKEHALGGGYAGEAYAALGSP